MATIPVVTVKLFRGAHEFKWASMAQGDDGGPLDPQHGSVAFADKTVTLTGTYGVGATLVIEGSNDNVNWFTLKNTHDNADLSFTTGNQLHGILENPEYIRPNITGGDGTTALTVIIAGRGILQLR